MSSLIKVDKLCAINFFDLSPSFNKAVHNHSDWEFIYVDSGEVTSILKDECRYLRQGDVIFHRPEQTHSTFCNGKNSASIFNVHFVSSSLQMEYFEGRKLAVSPSAAIALKRLIEESNLTYSVSNHPLTIRPDSPFGGEQMCRILLEEFLILLMRAPLENSAPNEGQPSDAPSTPHIEEICKFMKDNLYGKLTLDDLVAKFHFSKSFLCEQFKKSLGNSPISYYLDLKLKEAKRLLREDAFTVTEISEMLCFESPEYFSRYFKKRVGHSPRAFRNMLINDASLHKIK